MFKTTIARRYSEALFSLANEADAAEKTVKELNALVAALDKDPELAAFFESPVVDREVKQEAFIKALAGASELTTNFVVLLVRKRRENLIRRAATAHLRTAAHRCPGWPSDRNELPDQTGWRRP